MKTTTGVNSVGLTGRPVSSPSAALLNQQALHFWIGVYRTLAVSVFCEEDQRSMVKGVFWVSVGVLAGWSEVATQSATVLQVGSASVD